MSEIQNFTYSPFDYHFDSTIACIDVLRGIIAHQNLENILSDSPTIRDYLKRSSQSSKVVYDASIHGLHQIYDKFVDCDAETCQQGIRDIIDLYSAEKDTRVSNAYIQHDFARLIGFLAKKYECADVFEPFAGKATFAEFLSPFTSYRGQEINPRLCMLANLRLESLHRHNSSVEPTDSFNSFYRSDLIISEMPWGLIGPEKQVSERYFLQEASFFARKVSLGIYPYGILFRDKQDKALREKLVESDLIECVIKLPQQLYAPYTNVQTCIIITNRHKKHEGSVRFIDASEYFVPEKAYTRLDVERLIQVIQKPDMENRESMWVSNMTILENDSDLTMERYLPVDLPEVPDGCRLVQLKELLARIGKCKPTDLPNIPLYRVSDLAVNPFDFTLGEKPAEEQPYNRAYVYVNEPALFISKFQPLKPTYFVAKCGGVYINPNMYAYKVNTKLVSPQYLLSELTKDYVQKQLVYTGTTVQRLTSKTFLDVKILLPLNREEQDISVVKGVQEGQVKRNETLSAELDVYLKEWGQRQHTLGHVVGRIDDIYDKLFTLCDEQGGVLRDDDVLGDNETVKDCYTKLKFWHKRLGELVDSLADGIAYEPADEIELTGFVENLKTIYSANGYTIDPAYNADNEFLVRFSEKRLYDVFENIFSNIQKYGFVEDRNDYVVRIEIKEADLKGKPAVSILIMNNGRELDPSMSPEKVFKWSETTGGKGLGGSRIKLSVKTYGGDVQFLVKDQLPDGFNAAYEIVLPII